MLFSKTNKEFKQEYYTKENIKANQAFIKIFFGCNAEIILK